MGTLQTHSGWGNEQKEHIAFGEGWIELQSGFLLTGLVFSVKEGIIELLLQRDLCVI